MARFGPQRHRKRKIDLYKKKFGLKIRRSLFKRVLRPSLCMEIFQTALVLQNFAVSLSQMGTGSFPGGKVRPGRAADHSQPSSAAVMEE